MLIQGIEEGVKRVEEARRTSSSCPRIKSIERIDPPLILTPRNDPSRELFVEINAQQKNDLDEENWDDPPSPNQNNRAHDLNSDSECSKVKNLEANIADTIERANIIQEYLDKKNPSSSNPFLLPEERTANEANQWLRPTTEDRDSQERLEASRPIVETPRQMLLTQPGPSTRGRSYLRATRPTAQKCRETDNTRCFECSQWGHFSRDCPNPGKRTCYKCGQLGNHIAANCRSKRSIPTFDINRVESKKSRISEPQKPSIVTDYNRGRRGGRGMPGNRGRTYRGEAHSTYNKERQTERLQEEQPQHPQEFEEREYEDRELRED